MAEISNTVPDYIDLGIAMLHETVGDLETGVGVVLSRPTRKFSNQECCTRNPDILKNRTQNPDDFEISTQNRAQTQNFGFGLSFYRFRSKTPARTQTFFR